MMETQIVPPKKKPLLKCRICGNKRETLQKQDVFLMCEVCFKHTEPPVNKTHKCRKCGNTTLNRWHCAMCLDLVGYVPEDYLKT